MGDLPPDMEADLADIEAFYGTPLQQYLDVFGVCEKRDPDAKAMRKELYNTWDPNGNGYLSLAETDAAIQASLVDRYGDEEGETLWARFRPCTIRAFNDAKDVGEPNSELSD